MAPSKAQLDAIIAQAMEAAAQASEEAARAAAAAEAEAAQKAASSTSSKKPRKSGGKDKKSKEKVKADNTKKMLKLVGDVVVKYMSRHRNDMEHEVFKKHAKEVSGMEFLLLLLVSE